MERFRKQAGFVLFGLGFGAGVPILSLAFDGLVLRGGQDRLVDIVQANPVHGFAALTPLAFGVAFHLFGRRQASLEAQRDAAKLSEQSLRRQVEGDVVTGLRTRAALVERLQGLVSSEAAGQTGEVQVVQVETDGIRVVNDTMGLSAGDELLARIARRLSELAGENRECYRLGGDDFVILSVGAGEGLAGFARKVVKQFDEMFEIEGFRVPVHAHVGAAVLNAADSSGTEVLARCDLALQRARGEGKGRAVVFTGELADEACQRMMMDQELQLAVDRDQLFVEYQPIVDTTSGLARGFEALLRWQHPQRGLIPPTEFIPVAEKSGLISKIGEFVLLQACAEAVKWPDHVKISVNVSVAQFKDRGFYMQVINALASTGLPGRRLILEVTESLLIDNMDLVQHTFDRLREIGVRFALDDFGTGFSSINHLRSLKLDTLKLDKSFADRIVADERELDVVRSIIDLSRAFDLKTTIEGVESVEQLEMMRNQGIHNAQGFYFARPMSAEDAAAMLAAEPQRRRLQIVG